MADQQNIGKKMFGDVSDSGDSDFSSASDGDVPAPPAAAASTQEPQTAVRHVDPAADAAAVAKPKKTVVVDQDVFDSASKKPKVGSPSRGKPQAVRYPAESPAPLVKHIHTSPAAATPESKTRRAATPATTSKPAVARQREEMGDSMNQEMDPRSVRIELKEGRTTADNSGVKRRATSGSFLPASATSRASASAGRLRAGGARDEHDSLLGSSSSDEDFHVADYIFPRLDADLINHDRHTAKTSRNAVKPPNCTEFIVSTMLTIDVRVAVYFGMLILCLILTIVSIPTSQIDGVDKSCYTYYGFKRNCDAATYTEPVSLMACRATASRLQAGAAFSIIALVVYLVNFVICFIVVFCLRDAPQKVSLKSRMVLGSVGVVNVVVHLIPWAAVAGIYSARYCEDKQYPRTTAYGVGFGLCLTAWVLNLLCVIVIFAVPTSVAKLLRSGA